MTRWFWVRHGPTHQTAFTGHRDVPADLTDRDAIARLDAFLPQPALLVSSDLVRATTTAAVLARGRDLLAPARDIREFDFGDWDGLHHTEVSARDPVLARRFWEEPGDLAAPRGESWNAVAARVDGFVDAMTERHPGRDIVAVAHLGVILTQVRRGLGVTPYEALGYRIEPLSVTEVVHDGAWRTRRIGHVP